MAAYTIAKNFTTITVLSTGDTITTRHRFVKVKNLGANVISYSDSAAPTGAVTAGAQSSIVPVPSTGVADSAILAPGTLYYFTAATGSTLAGFEEIPATLRDF